MAIHLINQQHQACNALQLVTEGDTVIVTNEDAASEIITKLANFSVTVALLEGTAFQAEEDIAGATYKLISEDDWVRYTTSDEAVISWG